MVDFHSHILPGIDDGSRSRDESIEMLRLEAQQGITHVVATPHFYAREERLDHFLEKREYSERILRNKMEEYSGLPELLVGAEVSFFRGISESTVLHELTITGTNGILIEMPAPPWTDAMFAELHAIAERQQLVPIIAHIDRYIGPWCTFRIPQRLAQLPVLVQANAESFLDRHMASLMLRLLREGKIHLLGSDCHNLTERKPNIADAVPRITQKLGPDALSHIHAQERCLLSNLP